MILEQTPVADDAGAFRIRDFRLFSGRGFRRLHVGPLQNDSRHLRGNADEQGREHHGQDAGGQENLIGVVADEFETEGGLGKHEGEFSHLRQTEGGKQRRAHGILQYAHGRDGHEYLGRNDARRTQGDDGQMGKEEAHVEQHAHGNEEDAGKDFLEGHDAFQRVEAVLRLRHHETGQKRPQRQGKPQP